MERRLIAFHAKPIEEVFRDLNTSSDGLSKVEADRRLKQWGLNSIQEDQRSFWGIFFRQFHNPLVYILIIASLISLAIGEWVDFCVINVVIFFNSLLGFWQEVKAESSLKALKKLTESKNTVIRSGKLFQVHSSELVPGDCVQLQEGELVTADMRLIESFGLMIDESAITGESLPIPKDPLKLLPEQTQPYDLINTLLSGTSCVRGKGKAIVVNTGVNTYFASIVEKAKIASPETPLVRSLRFFAQRYISLILAFFLFLGIYGYFQGRSLIDIAYFLIASFVSVVPEGLPLVVSLVMVIGAVSLAKSKVFVRHLPSVETLGSATVIASDKTGTITTGNLIVKTVFTKEEKLLKTIAALCNDSEHGTGDPLDLALSQWVQDYSSLRSEHPRHWSYPFNPKLMLMATVNAFEGEKVLFVKGAFEALKEKAIDFNELALFEEAMHQLSGQGLRVLAFGIGKWEKEDPSDWKIKFVGLIGFLDPPKAGVREAVAQAKLAGIHVMMITGDHLKTAQAIAYEVGIWEKKDSALLGSQIQSMSDEELYAAAMRTTVLARILPEHKYRIVRILQEKGEIVAVSGDGINDVPALKKADLGIAMGSGTEAAKDASKMVITDSNLTVIVQAIRMGRAIAQNIRKVIYYLTSTSLQSVTIISLSILAGLPLPFTAGQILWVNIVADGVQDKFFAFAKQEFNLMGEKPRAPAATFFDLSQLVRILLFGIILGIGTFLMYIYLLKRFSYEETSTIIFTSLCTAQWANGIQAQKEKEPFFKNVSRSFLINPWIYCGAGVGMLMQLCAIYLLPELFKTIPMSLAQWKYPLFAFLGAFGLVELRKWAELRLKKLRRLD
ncbi:MAG: cation-transporting P-type ATPase [Verrucomicrobia bacterium]|nr:cation-transporting P-type ATPase [Verrucomicrobiota bacterium]